MAGIRIDDLPTTVNPSSGHEIPAMKDGLSVKLTLEQVLGTGPSIEAKIHAASSKSAPVDADELALVDSAASNSLKKLTWSNLKAKLKAVFDALYLDLSGGTMTGSLKLVADATDDMEPVTKQQMDGLAPRMARAWVNFNGTGTVAIRDSINVSSITDNGTGDYTVNFAAALADANYAVVGTCAGATATQLGRMVVIKGVETTGPSNKTTTAVSVLSGNSANAVPTDNADINIVIL